jgi:hypothetical protein
MWFLTWCHPICQSCSYFLRLWRPIQELAAFTYILEWFPYFSSSNFEVSDLIFDQFGFFWGVTFLLYYCFTGGTLWLFDPFWIDFCTGWETRVWFQSSTCGYPVFPAAFVEEAIFFPTYSCGKNQIAPTIWAYFWAVYSIPLVCVSVFVPVSHGLCYYKV